MPLFNLNVEAGHVVTDDSWRTLSNLGWLGVSAPAEIGGVGATFFDEVLLFREFGRHLTAGPVVGTVLGVRIALDGGFDELAAELIAGNGRRSGLVSGTYGYNLRPSDLGVVLTADGASLVEVSGYQATRAVDTSVELAHVERGKVIATVEGPGYFDRALVLAAAMALGGAERTLDFTARYAVERTQFGKAIGSFQAVKHRCATMAVRCEAAFAQLLLAAQFVEARKEDAPFQARCSFLLSTDAATQNGEDAVQNLGGIGFTAEHEAHLYVKRAHMLRSCLGRREPLYRDVLEAPPVKFDW
jgi:alkylation response protein AidB-like acyl-CoA dehydrogenase